MSSSCLAFPLTTDAHSFTVAGGSLDVSRQKACTNGLEWCSLSCLITANPVFPVAPITRTDGWSGEVFMLMFKCCFGIYFSWKGFVDVFCDLFVYLPESNARLSCAPFRTWCVLPWSCPTTCAVLAVFGAFGHADWKIWVVIFSPVQYFSSIDKLWSQITIPYFVLISTSTSKQTHYTLHITIAQPCLGAKMTTSTKNDNNITRVHRIDLHWQTPE
jgi:hypothetical protein